MANMKFRVEGVTHSVLIQRALFRMGYGWHAGEQQAVAYETMPYLYADDDDGCKNISYSNSESEAFFLGQPATEYVYRIGMVEPRDGRPVHHDAPPVLDSDSPSEMHAHMPDPKPYIRADLIQANTIQFDKVPLGIKPRSEADRMHHLSRGLELGQAISRYTNAQLPIPMEWLTEYNERVEEVRKLEKTA